MTNSGNAPNESFMAKSSLIRSTGVVAASTLASRVLGFIRDMIVANYFGASASLDGFFVAFRIPNLLRRLVAEGALTISFIPVYTEYLVKKSDEEALALAQKTFTLLLLVLSVLVALGVIFSPEIVRVFAYGFSDESVIGLTIDLNRIMFPYLFFVGIVAFAMGVLNSHGYFFAPSFSPVLLNVGFIFGAVCLRNIFDEPLYGLAVGVIIGGVMQAVLQAPYMVKSGFKMKISFDLNHPGIRRIFRLITPALFGIAIYQINIFMSTVLASMLPPGSISYLYYSDRLTELVLGVFIVSIGNVILPEMSRVTAMDDYQKLRELYRKSVQAALFLAIPAAAALIVVGLPVISVLFVRGAFTSEHARLTYRALLFSSMGIIPIAVLRISTPTFYSLKDTRTPVMSSALSFVLNIGLGYLLMRTALKHAGLSLANSIAAAVQIGVLYLVLRRKIGGEAGRRAMGPVLKMLFSALVMSLAVMYIAGFVDWFGDSFTRRFFFLCVIVGAGSGIYLAVCMLAGVEEAGVIKRIAGRILGKG